MSTIKINCSCFTMHTNAKQREKNQSLAIVFLTRQMNHLTRLHSGVRLLAKQTIDCFNFHFINLAPGTMGIWIDDRLLHCFLYNPPLHIPPPLTMLICPFVYSILLSLILPNVLDVVKNLSGADGI